MEEKYYIVRQKMHPETRVVDPLHGVSFIRTLEEKIEHVIGDPKITEMMCFKEGELRKKEDTASNYEISEVGKKDFDFQKSFYSGLVTREHSENRINGIRMKKTRVSGGND